MQLVGELEQVEEEDKEEEGGGGGEVHCRGSFT